MAKIEKKPARIWVSPPALRNHRVPAKLGEMGKVIVKIKLTNLFDLGAQRRNLSTAQPREVEVEALVDTGATRLYLKPSIIRQLGLEQEDSVVSQPSNGAATRGVYEPVRSGDPGAVWEFRRGERARECS